jgi:hypothetical protein
MVSELPEMADPKLAQAACPVTRNCGWYEIGAVPVATAQDRMIEETDAVAAARPDTWLGAIPLAVVTVIVADVAEPWEFSARTSRSYGVPGAKPVIPTDMFGVGEPAFVQVEPDTDCLRNQKNGFPLLSTTNENRKA